MEPHILFVEDDSDTRQMVQILLSIAGFRVSVAERSKEALELMGSEHFDVLLLDNWMPDMTGLALCGAIRLRNKEVPIVFCSGAATQAEIGAALAAGAQSYVTKPFEPETLIQTLRAALANGRA
jgi:DNA-binding response OmpR family regulator